MKQIVMISALGLALALFAAGSSVAEECYADYKAKQDNPLRLHYGVIQLQGPCKKAPAKSEVSARLAPQGWTLLNIMSVFGPEGLQQRKADAGSYYLRF
ncbi:MAG: hypothetical protein GJ676_18385 [Rhodobacteraceae bacterium]|nr:hypothetical protein [Paracoccaceae bacterium]